LQICCKFQCVPCSSFSVQYRRSVSHAPCSVFDVQSSTAAVCCCTPVIRILRLQRLSQQLSDLIPSPRILNCKLVLVLIRNMAKHLIATYLAVVGFAVSLFAIAFIEAQQSFEDVDYYHYVAYALVGLTTVLVIVTFVALVGICRHKLVSGNVHLEKMQRRCLVSFAVYNITLVLLNLPIFGII
uniref:Conserved plasma membrane protein n=1 Tax=Gongylonema pulchrum TaxID=637853 RepID=A0A183CYN8_9BILA